MAWVAVKVLRLGDGLRSPGDLVPEADGWPGYLRSGQVEWVESVSEPTPPSSPRPAARKPAAKKPAVKKPAGKAAKK